MEPADLLIPRVTFTSPGVAGVRPATGHTVRTYPHSEVDRAVSEADTAGFSRLVLDRRGRLIPAAALCDRRHTSSGSGDVEPVAAPS